MKIARFKPDFVRLWTEKPDTSERLDILRRIESQEARMALLRPALPVGRVMQSRFDVRVDRAFREERR